MIKLCIRIWKKENDIARRIRVVVMKNRIVS